MKLNKKLRILLFCFSFFTIAFMLLIGNKFYMKGYLTLEESSIKKEYNKFKLEFNGLIKKNEDTLYDWANWDETYMLVTQNKDVNIYADKNLVAADFINYGFEYFIVLDKNNNVVLSREVKDAQKLNEIQNNELLEIAKKAKLGSKIYNFDEKNLIISKTIITDSSLENTTEATMTFMFFLDNNNVSSLINIDNDNIKINSNVNKEFDEGYKVIKNGAFILVEFFVPYENSNKGILVKVKLDREVYNLDSKAFYELLIVFIVFLSIMTLILNLFLKHYIVDEILMLNDKVEDITSSGDLNNRVHIQKRTEDEIDQLKLNINEMLDKIQLLQQRVINYAKYDVLTGCYNRRFGVDRLENHINTMEAKEKLTVCFIDVNDLKVVNDNYGHLVGDELLKDITKIIKSEIRNKDYLIRIGGDEFLIVLPKTSLKESEKIVKEISIKLREYNEKENEDYVASIAIGCMEYKEEYSVDYFIDLADKEMYMAKQRMKNN